jgi:hypothetical protein
MKRKSGGPGRHTSDVEVTNVSQHGLWIMLDERERFLSFDAFPWFRQATIGELTNVVLCAPGHLRWPALDIDVAVESIDDPDSCPLVSKATLTRP